MVLGENPKHQHLRGCSGMSPKPLRHPTPPEARFPQPPAKMGMEIRIFFPKKGGIASIPKYQLAVCGIYDMISKYSTMKTENITMKSDWC
jgi:hypothetical protein